MPSAVEQALISLIPSVNSIPTDLTKLANALLSQSRSVAAKLKADQEIGRTYACAHIAVERLQSRLSLPIPRPNPPLPKTKYAALKKYLDTLLQTPSTPRHDRHADPPGSGRSARTPTTRHTARTPTKDASAQQLMAEAARSGGGDADTPSRRAEKRTPRPSAKALESGGTASAGRKRRRVEDVSDWKVQMAELLGERFGEANVKGLVLAGLKVVEGTPKVGEGEVPALLAVLALYVVFRLRGKEIGDGEFLQMREIAVGAARGFEEGRAVGERELVEQVGRLMRVVKEEGWLEMEWYASIPVGGGQEMQGLQEDVEMSEASDVGAGMTTRKRPAKTPLHRKEKHAKRPEAADDDDSDTASGLQAGLGTMFNDAVDWLSDERREKYVKWEADIMKRIEKMETSTGRRQSREVAAAG